MSGTTSIEIPNDDMAVWDVLGNAAAYEDHVPTMDTLSEEYAEAFLAYRGKHEHSVRLELVQLAGICINLIRRLDNKEDISQK